jgi:MoxR-like ATPase
MTSPRRDEVGAAIARVREQFDAVMHSVSRVILGKEDVVAKVLVAMAARGHVLLKDVPGVGKTMLAKTIAASVACQFKRIQFTPDLLPMDVSGSNVFDMRKKAFEFQPGPVFTNILLADEINRATPKTQSALLEVMEERQVTVEGETHRLDAPFQVLATMNPLDHEGTYPLPAAQLDRFMMMLSMGYPNEMAEVQMLTVHLQPEAPLGEVRAAITREDFVAWQQTVPLVYLSEDLKRYVVALIGALRGDPRNLQSVSPRSTILLARAAQARAMLRGRDYVTAEDVQMMAPDVLGHRVMLADSRAGREFVAESLANECGGDGEHLAHPRSTDRPFIANHHHVTRLDAVGANSGEGRLLAIEDARRSAVMTSRMSGELDDRALWCE